MIDDFRREERWASGVLSGQRIPRGGGLGGGFGGPGLMPAAGVGDGLAPGFGVPLVGLAAFNGVVAAADVTEPPLKVPDPGQALVSRLFGRDYVYPEQAANTVLENGAGSGAVKLVKGILKIGPKEGEPPVTRIAPGGGLKAHEGSTGRSPRMPSPARSPPSALSSMCS